MSAQRSRRAGDHGELAQWLASRLGCTPREAAARLQTSRAIAARMLATPAMRRAEAATGDDGPLATWEVA